MAPRPRTAESAITPCPRNRGKFSGTNENTNGLLREYLPRTSDLSIHDQNDLDELAARLNTRPRKRLGYLTPSEVFNQLALQ